MNYQKWREIKMTPAYKTFNKSVTDILCTKLAKNVDKTLETMLKAEENWFWGSILKIFK